MGIEIERKFLLRDNAWRLEGKGIRYLQGYLLRSRERTVRIRIAGSKGYLTVKGEDQNGVRPEYEYSIPFDDAHRMLEDLCEKPLIDKVRHRIRYRGNMWEVDEFAGENRGLVLAEVELKSPNTPIAYPPWIGREVTGDTRYINANLVSRPFTKWPRRPGG